MMHFIKFRPIKPKSPHLNGKIERSQLTDIAEFYRFMPKKEREMHLDLQLLHWQNFYNCKRLPSSLKGKTPTEKLVEVEHLVPIQPDVTAKYWEKEVEIVVRSSKWYYHKLRGTVSHMPSNITHKQHLNKRLAQHHTLRTIRFRFTRIE